MYEYLNQPQSEIQISDISHHLRIENDTLKSINDPFKIEQILKECLPSWMYPKITFFRGAPILIKWKCEHPSCQNWGKLKRKEGNWIIKCQSDSFCRHIIDMNGMNLENIKQFNHNFPAKLPQPVKY